jgi:hypothetical protein
MANNNDTFELSDEQLEMVSGGSLISISISAKNDIQVANFIAPTVNTIAAVGFRGLKADQVGASFKNLGLSES